jgi:hypothetical protein
VAFKIQDLMMDVRPGAPGGYRMANPECTCQITVKPEVQEEPELPSAEEGDCGDGFADQDTTGECPPDQVDALAANLTALRAQLRRHLGL